MTITTAFCCLLCALSTAVQENPRPMIIACNLKAISPAQRPTYLGLMKRLRAAVRERSEVTDGFAYTLESHAITLAEIAAWMSMERLCCPFLKLQLAVAGNQATWQLSLTGPPGVKALLAEEFPNR